MAKSAFTDSFQMFNSNYSSLRLGFMNNRGFISISPVFEKYKGRKAKKGMNMYDYDNRTFFYFRPEESLDLMMRFDSISKGEDTYELVVDGGQNRMTQKITIGIGIFEDETADKKKKNTELPLQVVIEKYDEYDSEDGEIEPLETVVYQSKEEESIQNIQMFKIWLEVLNKYISSGLAEHIAKYAGNNDQFNRFGSSRESGNSRGGKFRRRNSDEEDFDEEDSFDDDKEESPRQKVRSRSLNNDGGRRPVKKSSKTSIKEDDAFGDDENEESFDD